MLTFSPDELDLATSENGEYVVTKRSPGTDSPVGCGANSDYYVTWSIVRQSPSTPVNAQDPGQAPGGSTGGTPGSIGGGPPRQIK